jgi:hypothetical protein
VKICSLYGAGFYYIPGTDTCLKVGGWVRAEYNINAGGSFNPYKVDPNLRTDDDNTIRARAMITLDARAQTEYGTLRSYIASGWNTTNGGDALYVPRAFIQLGGFTWGKAESFYDFYVTPAYSNTTNVWGADTGGGGDTVAAYTAQLGNGLSATISLEDPLTRRTAIVAGTVATTGYISGPYWPDVVANLRVDQAWGSAQVMGAIHQVAVGYSGAAPTLHAEDKVGWAVGAGIKVNLPMLGKGDNISAEVDYSEGAIKYAGGGIGSFAVANGATAGVGAASDATIIGAGAGELDLTKAWAIVGGYQHAWNAQWKTTAYGTYGKVDPTTVVAGVDPSWTFWQAGTRTVWTPVANLDLSVDVMYNELGSAGKSLGFTDQSWWQAIFRVQRNFYP